MMISIKGRFEVNWHLQTSQLSWFSRETHDFGNGLTTTWLSHEFIFNFTFKLLFIFTFKLLQAVPHINDPECTTTLSKLTNITFETIYNFLVDQKVVVKKVSDLESVADRRAELLCNPEKGDACVFHNDWTLRVPIEYTRTHEKTYCFSKIGMCRKWCIIQCWNKWSYLHCVYTVAIHEERWAYNVVIIL